MQFGPRLPAALASSSRTTHLRSQRHSLPTVWTSALAVVTLLYKTGHPVHKISCSTTDGSQTVTAAVGYLVAALSWNSWVRRKRRSAQERLMAQRQMQEPAQP